METLHNPARITTRQQPRPDAAGNSRSRPGDEADEQVIQRVLAGDRDAFETLVRRHHRAIYHYIYRMVGRGDLAADLTQEVFLKVYLALASFDPAYRFTTWIYRIASNRVIDHIRRSKMVLVSLDTPADSEEAPRREVASCQRDPQDLLLDQESARDVAGAIQDLPGEYRELIILRHFQHRSYDEIAQIKNRPLGTVKNRLFRAREALRRRMAL